MAQFWRMICHVESMPTDSHCSNVTDTGALTVEYWKDKIFKERQSYHKSLSILQKENDELRSFVKNMMREAKTIQPAWTEVGLLDVEPQRNIVDQAEMRQVSFKSFENIEPNCKLWDYSEVSQQCNKVNLDSDRDEVIALNKRIQTMTEEKKLLRSKCKSYIVKLNEKLTAQDKVIKQLEREIHNLNRTNKLLNLTDGITHHEHVSAIPSLHTNEASPGGSNLLECGPNLELQISILENQLMGFEDITIMGNIKTWKIDEMSDQVALNPNGSEQDILCILGHLQDKYDKLKAAFTNGTQKLSDKIKSLQSTLLTKTNENKTLKHQNKQLESRIQVCQKDFGAIKAKLIGMRDDQAKYLAQYESKLEVLREELGNKNKEIEKLQIVIKNDKERFLRMKSSIHKIVELNKTSSTPPDRQQRSSWHDEMHRIYIEEIHKRFDEQELEDLSDLSASLLSFKKSLRDALVVSSSSDDDYDYQHMDQAYQAALTAGGTLSEELQQQEPNYGKLLRDHMLRLSNALEEKSEECNILMKEAGILRDRLNQIEFRFDMSKLSQSWEWLSESTDLMSDGVDIDVSKSKLPTAYTLRIIELETKITQLQQEISALSRLTPAPTPMR